ncbi:MAG TPA: hypothetical protein VLG38_01515 [Gammaproteobacteria bacterium]|nr:hypothetical protein [Gammaproteobacteria bacterium]
MKHLTVIKTISIVTVLLLVKSVNAADDPAITQDLNQIKALKLQLFNDLSNGDITSSTFDKKTEMDIAESQMAVAKYYLSIGDRKNAAICAITARKILQGLYGGPNNPDLVRVYSLLVQIYNSDVDTDAPGTDASDADKAKLYRQLIDHIHAE